MQMSELGPRVVWHLTVSTKVDFCYQIDPTSIFLMSPLELKVVELIGTNDSSTKICGDSRA